MENIYKIKIRSDLNSADLYPSERRYSASIVLGLAIMFLVLGIMATLMGTLQVQKTTNYILKSNLSDETLIYEKENENNSTDFEQDKRFVLKIEKELVYQAENVGHIINIPALMAAGCFIMALGTYLAGLFGLLAWKRWYIDQNITWFFLSASFAIFTSTIALMLIIVTIMESESSLLSNGPNNSEISLGLMVNILINSVLGVIWSILASRVAYQGMKNNYPDDLVLARKKCGKVHVNLVRKGNRIAKVVQPDILNNFPKTGKMAKFLPNKSIDNGDLPKAESNKEYEERVKKFLAEGQNDETEKNT